MFIDEVVVRMKSGDGGDGAATFRREKSVQFGGPDGGDGGRGGDIVIVADPNVNTLIDFQYKKEFKAKNGENGAKKQCYGKNGEDLIIKVPVGTQIRDEKTGKLLLDMEEPFAERVLLKGGAGGLGNMHFKTSTKQAPRLAGRGKDGEELTVKLELKLIADVALVGFPSVGKSSFINRVSAANSKVAQYHFTTLEPKLGVVRLENGKSFVIADIPGLIEGAHEGVGLGDKFLRHTERCRMIYHIVDISGSEGRDPYVDYTIINQELTKFSPKLAQKQQIILANKMDMCEDDSKYLEFKAKVEKDGVTVYPVSVLQNDGIKPVLYKAYEIISSIPKEPIEEESDIATVLDSNREQKERFKIEQIDSHTYEISGRVIDDVLNKYVIGLDEDSIINFLQIMRSLGIEKEMEKAGIKEGDTVRIADVEFDYVE